MRPVHILLLRHKYSTAKVGKSGKYLNHFTQHIVHDQMLHSFCVYFRSQKREESYTYEKVSLLLLGDFLFELLYDYNNIFTLIMSLGFLFISMCLD